MADETPTPNAGDSSNGEATPGGDRPSVHTHAQYVKDLSFENPNALEVMSGDEAAPEMEVTCNLSSTRVGDSSFEVVLSLEAKARRDDKTLFLTSLDYAGLFTLANIPDAQLEPVLRIHCPTLLFPFARQILAEVTRNGGYPPLLLDMVDFQALYVRDQERQRRPGGDADPAEA